jgi:DNA-directed RNA polymerase subunit omega
LIYPSIDEMLGKVDSRYSLVIMAAKRARSLREQQILKDNAGGSFKEVSSALEDVVNGKITFQRIKDGIK